MARIYERKRSYAPKSSERDEEPSPKPGISSNLLMRRANGPTLGARKNYRTNLKSLDRHFKRESESPPGNRIRLASDPIESNSDGESDAEEVSKKRKPHNMFNEAVARKQSKQSTLEEFDLKESDGYGHRALSKPNMRFVMIPRGHKSSANKDNGGTDTKKNGEDLGLSKEEAELETKLNKSENLAKLMSRPTDSSWEGIRKMTAGNKSSKKEEKIKFTEEESALEKESSKIGKLLAGIKSGGDLDFSLGLKKDKVTKDSSETIEKPASIPAIDLDEEFDTGLHNNFEELDEAKNFKKQERLVREKYANKKYPGSLSQQEIEQKAAKHLKCVPKILSGNLASPYYGHASDIAKKSSSTVLSSSEFLSLPIGEFTIGFYGLKRQSAIASIIKRKFQDELDEAEMTNKTIQFWSLDSFVFYVLACDVAVRMAASELDISTGEAFDVLYDTVDYGKYLTDPIPL